MAHKILFILLLLRTIFEILVRIVKNNQSMIILLKFIPICILYNLKHKNHENNFISSASYRF